MESPYGSKKMIFLASLPILFLCCIKSSNRKTAAQDFSFLQNGDLIYRKGNGYFSNRFKDFSENEKIYSHVGIVQKTTDSVFVIHAEASELTGIGYVKKENVSIFLEGIHQWAICRINTTSENKDAIAAAALYFHIAKTPFDLNFDVADTSAVYCSELVALCVNKVLGTPIIKADTQRGGKRFIAIDDTYKNENTELIFQFLDNIQ